MENKEPIKLKWNTEQSRERRKEMLYNGIRSKIL